MKFYLPFLAFLQRTCHGRRLAVAIFDDVVIVFAATAVVVAADVVVAND